MRKSKAKTQEQDKRLITITDDIHCKVKALAAIQKKAIGEMYCQLLVRALDAERTLQ